MASATSIANAALLLLGERRISSLDEDSKTARILKERYQEVRDAMLRLHPWNFATKRASLAADATSPEWGFSNAFTLPNDCLRVLELDNPSNEEYRIEGRKIVTDLGEPLLLEYTRQVTEVGEMDVLFRQALAASLAFDACEAITGTSTKVQELAAIAEKRLNDARFPDGQEPSLGLIEASEWLDARETGGSNFWRVPSGEGTPL